MSSTAQLDEVLIGRQPIFDARMSVLAYELFFRYGASKRDPTGLPASATAHVLATALSAFGLDRLVSALPASVNVSREFLISNQELPVPTERLMLELSARAGCDQELLASIDRWKARGFKIAIDEVYVDDVRLGRLFERADVLKIDCLERSDVELTREVPRLVVYGCPLLAAKIENRRQFDVCRDLGFEQFQGYFLERPGNMRTRVVHPSRAVLLQLVTQAPDGNAERERVEALVRADAGLSLRVLRCVNSAAVGLPRRVDSITDAITCVGTNNVRHLASLMLLSEASDEPPELLRTALFRARLCELLALALGRGGHERCFTVGLLSLLESLMGEPLPALLKDLPLSDEVRAALLQHEGEAGRILRAVTEGEHKRWEAMLALGLSADVIRDAWLAAVQWVDEQQQQFGARA